MASGKVQTTTGLINPDELGNTQMHEHIYIKYTNFFEEPSDPCEKEFATKPFSLEHVHWIQYNYNKSLPNLTLDEPQVAERELELFKKYGGKTIVEVTTHGIGRNPTFLSELSQKTGINIISGAGFYLDCVHPEDMNTRTESDLENQMVKEVTEGIDGTTIKAGLIGEIGCSWPLTQNERKVLRAAARAQNRCGCALMVHPGRNVRAPMEILNILIAAGANMPRVIMCHIDRTVHDWNVIREIVATGCVLEYDLFGSEISYYPYASDVPGMPNDTQRIQWVKRLVDEGFVNQVVISHDVYTKHRLSTYGGHGYGHILKNIVPRMKTFGITDENITQILQGNPKRLLTFL
eukprot:Phypoly_transcript_11670.p1 GENE.Phypoly_transcript_11670~~Phypoly_transcript_11670.p1  ORF type:complete len:349 (+),score=52.06 Phypoly_transcript_11670:86-1132(+)